MKIIANLFVAVRLFLVFYALLFLSCAPELTGQKFFLFVTGKNQSLLNDVVVLASASSRSQGTELVFASLDKFLTASTNDLMRPIRKHDALAIVLYLEQWDSHLESRIKTLRALLLQKNISLGIWFIGRSSKLPLPQGITDWQGKGFDAVSSASAERPGKKIGKKFMAELVRHKAAAE